MSSDKDVTIQLMQFRAELALEQGLDLEERSIQVVGDIDEKSFCAFDAKMSLLETQSRGAITVKICSEGGSVYDALAIVGRMQKSKCKVITEGYGCIMSAATIILAAGNKRRMHRLAWFMTHESSYIVEGKHAEIKNYVGQADREERMWCEAMAELSDKSITYWGLLNSGQDKFLTAAECLDAGVIDEVF